MVTSEEAERRGERREERGERREERGERRRELIQKNLMPWRDRTCAQVINTRAVLLSPPLSISSPHIHHPFLLLPKHLKKRKKDIIAFEGEPLSLQEERVST